MQNESAVLPSTRLIDKAPLVVIGMLLIDGLHFVWARLLLGYLPPLASAFYIMAISTVQVAIFAKVTGRFNITVLRRHWWFFAAIGFLVAASTNLGYSAVAFIDPGTASMLNKSGVIFGLGFGVFWLKDRFNRWQSLGAALAIVGVFTITFQPGDYLRMGAFMVLAGTLMYTLHAALVKRYSVGMSLTDFFLFRLLGATFFLFLFAAGSGNLVWPGGEAWLMLLATGTVDVVISRTLYYQALRQLNMSLHALVLTISPILAIGWSVLLFGTHPSLQQAIGGVGVLLGVLLVTLNNKSAAR
jgi:drug/metabolite transporter (DMT)-like permease